MSEDPEKRRRRFRFAFSLRTLFVVIAALAMLAGYARRSLDWIRQRHAFLAEKQATWDRLGHNPQGGVRYGTTRAPFPLEVFSETGALGLQFYVELAIDDDDARIRIWKHERDQALQLFPEAEHVTVNWEPWPVHPFQK